MHAMHDTYAHARARTHTHTHTHTHTDTHTGWHTHAQRHTRAHSLAQTYTPAHKFTHPHARNDTRARTHTHTHARNLFSRTFCTSREYCDYGYLKINGMDNTGSAISRREIDEIEGIQQGFQEYDFDLKISNCATRMFHMYHVPFANRFASSHFLLDRKLEKICA